VGEILYFQKQGSGHHVLVPGDLLHGFGFERRRGEGAGKKKKRRFVEQKNTKIPPLRGGTDYGRHGTGLLDMCINGKKQDTTNLGLHIHRWGRKLRHTYSGGNIKT